MLVQQQQQLLSRRRVLWMVERGMGWLRCWRKRSWNALGWPGERLLLLRLMLGPLLMALVYAGVFETSALYIVVPVRLGQMLGLSRIHRMSS